MKVTDLPNRGSFSPNQHDHYEWIRHGHDSLGLVKSAEADNPHYEAMVVFPNGVISRKQIDNWMIEIGTVDQNGGEQDLDPEYIDQFDPLFDFFFEKYGRSEQIIV